MARIASYQFYRAVHRDWQGQVMLDVKHDRIVHIETGAEGDFSRDGRSLCVKWDEFPADNFLFVDGTYYDLSSQQHASKVRDLVADGQVEQAQIEANQALRRIINLEDLANLPVFIMHYTPLLERKAMMDSQIIRFGLGSSEYITDYDREDISKKDIDKYYLDDAIRHSEMTAAIGNRFLETLAWNPSKVNWHEGVNYDRPHVTPYGRLSGSELSLCCKHALALEKASSSTSDISLILEDDAVLCSGFAEKAILNLSQTPQDWDIIFPGSALGIKAPGRRPDQVAYRMDPPHVRCSDSFFITKLAAARLRAALVPFTLPYDFELMYWLNKLALKTYWWEPSLVTQGSENGAFPSALR